MLLRLIELDLSLGAAALDRISVGLEGWEVLLGHIPEMGV